MPALLDELKGSRQNHQKRYVETSQIPNSSVQMRARAMHTTVIIQRSWLKFDIMIWKPLFSVPIKFLGAVTLDAKSGKEQINRNQKHVCNL